MVQANFSWLWDKPYFSNQELIGLKQEFSWNKQYQISQSKGNNLTRFYDTILSLNDLIVLLSNKQSLQLIHYEIIVETCYITCRREKLVIIGYQEIISDYSRDLRPVVGRCSFTLSDKNGPFPKLVLFYSIFVQFTQNWPFLNIPEAVLKF